MLQQRPGATRCTGGECSAGGDGFLLFLSFFFFTFIQGTFFSVTVSIQYHVSFRYSVVIRREWVTFLPLSHFTALGVCPSCTPHTEHPSGGRCSLASDPRPGPGLSQRAVPRQLVPRAHVNKARERGNRPDGCSRGARVW